MAYWKKRGLWPDASADAYWGYVSYLMATSSLSNANNNLFVDSSGAFNPVTRSGNTTQGTVTPYGTLWSNYFDGSGDYLTVPYSTAFDLSGSSWTMEAWFYSGSFASAQTIISKDTYGSNYDWGIAITNSTTIVVYTAGTASNLTATVPTMTPNTWYHVAVVRNSGVNSIYLNGVSYASNSMAITNNSQSFVTIGCSGWNNPNSFFPGYISNLRIVKGTAVYTSAFTPPAAPLTAVSGTSLLTCQSNRFRDASSNAFAITVNGDTKVTPFSPFVLSSPGAVYNQSDISYWSNYFNGSSYITMSSGTAAGTGDFTVEGWFNLSSYSTEPMLYDTRPNSTNGAYPAVFVSTSGYLSYYVNTAVQIQGATAVSFNTWNHFAVCRSGTSTKLFLNGVQQGSTYTDTNNYQMGASRPIVGGNGYIPGGASQLTGYVSNLRVVNGTALYTTAFTPPTSPLTAISGTVLLTCQNAAFTDNSTNKAIITPNGNTTVTGNNPYQSGYYGNYFDGNGDGLSISNYSSSALAFGTSDFTIEFWAFATTTPNNNWTPFFTMGTSGGGQEIRISQNINGTGFGWIYPNNTNNGDVYAGYGAMTTNTWHHIAMTRSGSTMRLFLDGAVVATGTGVSFNFTNTTLLRIGLPQPAYADGAFTGYLSNLRIVKGTAVYTAAFTPPTAPLTAISGTGLLTCQANSLIDSSANAFALTKVGDTSVSPFDPFYTATVASNGGSMYFDGNGDYLSAPNSPGFQFGAGNFTIELWAYLTATGGSGRGLISKGTTTGASFLIYQGTSNELAFYASSNGSSWDISSNQQFSSNIPLNTWHHIAVSRSGTTFRLFLNGALTTSFTSSAALVTNASSVDIGTFGSLAVNGYLSDVRLTSGTAVYTSAFTPPTAPLTPSGNTVLLLNGMNAGTYDAAMQNDLETSGGAQVSTGQAKYGTTSVFFNGSTDWLSMPNSPTHNFGTGDFTIESWVYQASTPGSQNFVSNYNSPSEGWGIRMVSGVPYFMWGDTVIVNGSAAISANTWTHIAVTRAGTTVRLFVGGTQVASATDSTNLTGTGTLFVGRLRTATAGFLWNGYLDDLRITKGVARYTANFTPPTAALPVY